MRPPRLRCTLFSLIYPPHLLGSYKRQLYGFVLFSRLTKRNLASYVISVRRTKSSLTASFRFHLTMDTLAFGYILPTTRRIRDLHPLETCAAGRTQKAGTQTVGKDYLRPGFLMGAVLKCYAIERHFKGKRYQVSPKWFSRSENHINPGCFCPYCVTRVRFFLMRSAACLRVMRFRQSGQYLTLFDFEAKNAPHSVQRFLSSVLKSSA